METTSQPLSETQEPTVASPAAQRCSHSAQPHQPQWTRSQEQMMAEQMKAKVSR